jgi:hypothetical protein
MHKIIFIALFYHTYGAQLLCLLSVLYHVTIKWVVTPMQPTSSPVISLFSSSFPTSEKIERIEK